MKAITIKQPWASLIVHSIKDIENRTWPCPKKYIGQRVLIHASKSKDKREKPLLTEEQYKLAGGVSGYGTHIFGNRGAIIGSVEIVDCVVNHPSIWAEKTDNYTVGMNPKQHEATTGKKVIYNWVLANPVLFEKPMPAKGKLSFWEYDGLLPFDAILEANKDVLKQIKEKRRLI